MVTMMFIFGVVLFAVSGRIAARAITVPRLKLKQHLRDIGDYGFAGTAAPLPETSRTQLNKSVALFAERAGRFVIAKMAALPPLKRGQLAAAGYYDITPEAVHGYRAIAAVFLAAFVFLCGLAMAGLSTIVLVLVVAAAGAGWQLPAVVITSKGKARLADIDKELPELIDLLIASVEAGQGFGGSLALVANRLQGALGEEVMVAIRQQNLGISTSEALEEMLERCDTPSMHAFVRAITRSESMGLSMAPVLRELATDMRRRRRQAAQEKMHKAPIKMLFPMMFLIMPAMMIVLFYPAISQVMGGLSGIH